MQKSSLRRRPKNLNLFTIRLPLNAVISIMHRMSGVILFLIQPVLLWVLALSLGSQDGYFAVREWMQQPIFKLLLLGLSWAFFHHFYAGLRQLAMDVLWMTSLQKARLSSRLVLGLVMGSVAVFAVVIW